MDQASDTQQHQAARGRPVAARSELRQSAHGLGSLTHRPATGLVAVRDIP